MKHCPLIYALRTFAILLLAFPSAGSRKAQAHDVFTAYVQHRVAITLDANYVDVTVQLTFFEEPSEHERERIDANGDGRLSRTEIDAYLHDLERGLGRAVRLRLGGSTAPLITLRAPEIDLLGQEHTGRGHHRLTLYYFARRPDTLAPGTEILVEDRLWPEVRALGVLQVEGRDGRRLEALAEPDPVYPPATENEPRNFKARILAPPTTSSKVAHPALKARPLRPNNIQMTKP